ncbi:unnamed protein product, partial [marine sediment metagenome]
EDQYKKGFTGTIKLKLNDYYKTVLPIEESCLISDGILEFILKPRAVYGLAPRILLEGVITYNYFERPVELKVSVGIGRKQHDEFELKLPEIIETEKPLSLELTSETYIGPFWLIYGKNEVFAQLNGEFTEENGSFKHSITIPKSYIGDITCLINYFDFEKKMEVCSIEKSIPISIEQHLLNFNIDFPSSAIPSEKVIVKVNRVKKSLEPWLLAFKLADKSLRGLDALTEFNLESIYSLTHKLSIATLALWKTELTNILFDLGNMIIKH